MNTANELRASWNPLACSDTSMRPHTLLMAKLAWLVLLAGSFWRPLGSGLAAPLPEVAVLASAPAGAALIRGIFWAGGLLLLFNRCVRPAAAGLGIVVMLVQLQSLPAARPHAWLAGCLLVTAALHGERERPVLVPGLVVLAHAAAGLSLLRTDAWTHLALRNLGLAEFASAPLLAGLLRWGSVAGLALIVATLLPAVTRKWALLGSLLFLLLVYGTSDSTDTALWVAVVAIAELSFLRWPRHISAIWPRACGLPVAFRVLLDRYDWEQRTNWPMPPDPDGELQVEFDDRTLGGGRAFCDLVMYFPPFYFASLLVVAALHFLLPEIAAARITAVVALVLLAYGLHPAINRTRAHLRYQREAGRAAAGATLTAETETLPRSDR